MNGTDQKENKLFAKVCDEVVRSADVQSDVTDFANLMISPSICDLLRRHHFVRPTPVQAKAIPLLMFGSDMLVQAKAGTGKTLVFCVLAAKLLHDSPKTPTLLVLMVVTAGRPNRWMVESSL